MKKNCMIAQSHGPVIANNKSLASVINEAASCGEFDTIYGAKNGIAGILDGDYMNITILLKENPDSLSSIPQSPDLYLGACPFQLPDDSDSDGIFKKIYEGFETMDISAFFYICDSNSMDTVLKLSAYGEKNGSPIRILGIPSHLPVPHLVH